jgi:beta-galactosidase GanA
VSDMPHLTKQGNSTQLIVDGKPFIMLGGELHNSSTAGFEYMRPIWKRMAESNLNTVIAAASWELVEPAEGHFNFALVDSMITGARREGLKLVVIWFASWKNGESTYVPSWVKKDQARFPLVVDEAGNKRNILSTFSEESCNADASAFAELMKHISKVDSKHHTVIMVQVENEMGTLRTKRDFSPKANAAFNGPVPQELMAYLEDNRESIHPGVMAAWEKQGFRTEGTWEEVFGKGELMPTWKDLSYLTEELFMAWNYAKYIGKIAEAGRAEYDIPMYVNAWLKQPGTSGFAPGDYPCGGPTPQVIDIWRAAAPSIDLLAPDIYIVDEFRYVCDQYTLSANPLFIPETRGDAASAARVFFAFGAYNTLGYAPFGIDGTGSGTNLNDISDIKDSYATLKQLMPLFNEGREMRGLLVDDNNRIDSVTVGGYTIMGSLGRRFRGAAAPATQGPQGPANQRQAGGALIICTGPGEYYIAGRNMSINFVSTDHSSNDHVSFLLLEDGTFVNNEWVTGRRLNGDEFRATLPSDGSRILKIALYTY